jgi:hypothetical protein
MALAVAEKGFIHSDMDLLYESYSSFQVLSCSFRAALIRSASPSKFNGFPSMIEQH